MFIYPYKVGSNSVGSLKKVMGAKLIRLEGSNFTGSPEKCVVNWGNSTPFAPLGECNLLNNPETVGLASNKLRFFNVVQDQINIPEFTTERNVAYDWVSQKRIVLVRERLQGHSGEGIVIIENNEEWEEYDHSRAKLYVQYIPKKHEFRVHVFDGEIIDVQRKAAPREVRGGGMEMNWKVRTHANGFIFVRNEDKKDYPQAVMDEAVKAIEIVGLDFGAVDVIYNEHRQKAYVLEINCAPGLENSTLNSYVRAIGKYFGKEFKIEEDVAEDPRQPWAPLTVDQLIGRRDVQVEIYDDEPRGVEGF